MTPQPHEVEIALLIAADDAPEVAGTLARATRLAGCELAARADQSLHDITYDMVDHALQAQGFALRTRLNNGIQLITLKGAPRRDNQGAVTRLEIEEPWSLAGFGKVAAELAQARISLAQPETFGGAPPSDALRALGLIQVQDRRNYRRVRDVLEPEHKKRLAELALDAVTYQFEGQTVEMYEVEIEAKQPDSAALLHACALALQTEFDAMLRPWPYGKLATGAMIERLVKTGELTPLLVNGHLIGAQASLLLEDRLRA